MNVTYLSMAKITVTDLDRCAAFYTSLCDFDQEERVEEGAYQERLLSRSDGVGATLVLVADGSTPMTGNSLLVFETDDLHKLLETATAAGGKVVQPPTPLEHLSLTYAFFSDPEQRLTEAIVRHR
jgi:predicted enzyme related to lactoylglutathione lyase